MSIVFSSSIQYSSLIDGWIIGKQRHVNEKAMISFEWNSSSRKFLHQQKCFFMDFPSIFHQFSSWIDLLIDVTVRDKQHISRKLLMIKLVSIENK